MDKLIALFHTDFKNLEFNRYGLLVSSILIQDITAAVAVLLYVQYDLSFVAICIVATAAMLANGLGIAQQPIKWVAGMSAISFVISVIMLICSFFVI